MTTTDIDQTYVVFDEINRGVPGKDYRHNGQDEAGDLDYLLPARIGRHLMLRWFESGQTWYYGVEKSGSKAANHWYGYTGYETSYRDDYT